LRANYDKLRQAEEAVRQDRDRLNLVIENVGDPILVCDNAACFVLLDPLARDLFGSESDSLRDELREESRTLRCLHLNFLLRLRTARLNSSEALRSQHQD